MPSGLRGWICGIIQKIKNCLKKIVMAPDSAPVEKGFPLAPGRGKFPSTLAGTMR
jgi:hypothetical protein